MKIGIKILSSHKLKKEKRIVYYSAFKIKFCSNILQFLVY